MIDRNLFNYEVKKNGYTLENVASNLGINPSSLYRKLAGKSDFTRAEMQLIREYLKLDAATSDKIFFATKLA